MKTASIIVTFNPDLELLERQLISISTFTTVILVDNASINANEIQKICTKNFNNIFLLQLQKNEGLGLAQNIGIKEAERLECSHVILFDQDSYFSRDSYDKLVEYQKLLISQGFKVAAVGPVCIDPTTCAAYPITQYRGPFIVRKYLNDVEECEASFIVASGSLIALKVIQNVGMMMDKLFIDYIDVEWCYRAQSLGYKLFVTKNSILEHRIGDERVNFLGRSISMHSATRRYYLTRNCFLILSLPYIPTGYKVREISLLFARILAFMYFSKERARYLKLMFYAILDASHGKYGKLEEKVPE